MAHSARLNSLTDGLVTSITGLSPNDKNFRPLREKVAKGLKDQSHGRTNQFLVNDSLAGLVEKFTVLNREDVAEALQKRIDELPTKSQWIPEVLALMLRLSRQPLENSNLDAVNSIVSPPVEDVLTWDDIFGDKPQTEDGLWDDVERGYHSSGDEKTVDGEHDSELTTSTQGTSVDDDLEMLARLHVVQPDPASLEIVGANAHGRVRNAQTFSNQMTELSAIRDSLTMLRGLPTSLYIIDQKSASIRVSANTAFSNTRLSTSNDVFDQFADIGSNVNYLRFWTVSNQILACLQSMQAVVRNLLMQFSTSISEIEQKYINPRIETTVSIIDARHQVETTALPLVQLSTVLRRSYQHADGSYKLRLLDLLYEESCIAQMDGDVRLFDTLTNVLFAGLRTYLKPIQAWIETGDLPTSDSKVFFVEKADNRGELGNAWYGRFSLRPGPNGNAFYAPGFMHQFIPTLFAMGKSQAFLKLLQKSDDSVGGHLSPDTTSAPDFEAVKQEISTEPLLPFPLLFSGALEDWINRSATDRVPALQSVLRHRYQSDLFFSSLRSIFFARNGAIFQEFADSLFARIQNNPKSWRQDFMLTELVQSTIGSTAIIDKNALAVRTQQDNQPASGSVSRDLESLILNYETPWPIQNITRSSSPLSHSQAFVLALQAYYTKSILRPELFTLCALELTHTKLPAHVNAAFRLRSNLIWFIDIIQDHFSGTTMVLHHDLCAAMEQGGDIDSMAAIWSAYEKKLQIRLLLAEKLSPVRRGLTDVMEICERFAQCWRQYIAPLTTSESKDHGPSSVGPRMMREMTRLQTDFQRLHAFIVAGLRGVSRAGGEPVLEALSERLEWEWK